MRILLGPSPSPQRHFNFLGRTAFWQWGKGLWHVVGKDGNITVNLFHVGMTVPPEGDVALWEIVVGKLLIAVEARPRTIKLVEPETQGEY